MKQKVMDAMQSFSRALMGPVLFLPIAGMLQAISSVMSNTALVTEGGVVWTLGKFINGGVGAVIGNLGILLRGHRNEPCQKAQGRCGISGTGQLSGLAGSQFPLAGCGRTDHRR